LLRATKTPISPTKRNKTNSRLKDPVDHCPSFVCVFLPFPTLNIPRTFAFPFPSIFLKRLIHPNKEPLFHLASQSCEKNNLLFILLDNGQKGNANPKKGKVKFEKAA